MQGWRLHFHPHFLVQQGRHIRPGLSPEFPAWGHGPGQQLRGGGPVALGSKDGVGGGDTHSPAAPAAGPGSTWPPPAQGRRSTSPEFRAESEDQGLPLSSQAWCRRRDRCEEGGETEKHRTKCVISETPARPATPLPCLPLAHPQGSPNPALTVLAWELHRLEPGYSDSPLFQGGRPPTSVLLPPPPYPPFSLPPSLPRLCPPPSFPPSLPASLPCPPLSSLLPPFLFSPFFLSLPSLNSFHMCPHPPTSKALPSIWMKKCCWGILVIHKKE